MKLFILILVLAIFLQTTLTPIDLCLMLLICRSFIVDEKINYYLAFFNGIFLGVLTSQNLGFFALFFLITVKLISLIKKTALTANFLSILPVAFLILLTQSFLEKFFFNQTINFNKIYVEVILILPIYLLVRFWEERFIVRPGIKLKI
ncbi:hypothetical protein HY025_03585 [Candidatus Daviesbacteria bacterium]|nr:hypothetical protein [Candidatus Daviesbacteria bacterium]